VPCLLFSTESFCLLHFVNIHLLMFKVTNYRLLGFLFSIKRDYMYVINLFSAYFSKELDEPITTQLPSNADTEPQYTHHFLVKRR